MSSPSNPKPQTPNPSPQTKAVAWLANGRLVDTASSVLQRAEASEKVRRAQRFLELGPEALRPVARRSDLRGVGGWGVPRAPDLAVGQKWVPDMEPSCGFLVVQFLTHTRTVDDTSARCGTETALCFSSWLKRKAGEGCWRGRGAPFFEWIARK